MLTQLFVQWLQVSSQPILGGANTPQLQAAPQAQSRIPVQQAQPQQVSMTRFDSFGTQYEDYAPAQRQTSMLPQRSIPEGSAIGFGKSPQHQLHISTGFCTSLTTSEKVLWNIR